MYLCTGMGANGSDLATDVMHLLSQRVCTAMLRVCGGVGGWSTTATPLARTPHTHRVTSLVHTHDFPSPPSEHMNA